MIPKNISKSAYRNLFLHYKSFATQMVPGAYAGNWEGWWTYEGISGKDQILIFFSFRSVRGQNDPTNLYPG